MPVRSRLLQADCLDVGDVLALIEREGLDMATLTAWKFASATGADEALETLQDLARRDMIDVRDAVLVSWPEGSAKPTTDRLRPAAGGDDEEGSELGLALGAEYFRTLSANVTLGTSALFALTTEPRMHEVNEAFRGTQAELLATNLTPEQEERLLGEFGLTGATA
jgi:uncharacterized membrane protein